MCEFCEIDPIEVYVFDEWSNVNPSIDDVHIEEGIKYMLSYGGMFYIAARFDSGYLSDYSKIQFHYCPMCGRSFEAEDYGDEY